MEPRVNKQFTFMTLSITAWTILYGGWLIGWASIVSISTNSQSLTSWIPALLGVPVLLMGWLCAFFPAERKIWLHVAVVVGALACLGGLDFFRPLAAGDPLFTNYAASASKLMLFTTGLVFVLLCIRSFIWARHHSSG